MRVRRRPERDEDPERPREAAAAPAPSPDAVLALIRRGAGNASVSRLIARQALVPEAEREGSPVVAPHEPGDLSADLRAFDGGKEPGAPVAAPADVLQQQGVMSAQP